MDLRNEWLEYIGEINLERFCKYLSSLLHLCHYLFHEPMLDPFPLL